MRHRRTLSSLLLALILLIGAAPTGRASEGPRVLYESQGSSALLALDGLGEGSVYAAQVELTLSGRYTSASFTPAGETAFSPDCRLTVQGEDTLVTFYITSVSPLNNEHDLPLGTLTLDESFSLPSQAVVTLLDRELKAFPGLQRSTLSTRAATLSTPTGSGSSGGSSVRVRRKVIIRDSDHGRVRTDMGQARSGDTVTLTVEPEEGYLLDKLNVVSVKGREISLFVGEDRFTFRMPDADVEVTATFLPIGKEQESLPFVDVTEEDWFCDPVSYVYRQGMMSGTSETTFSPGLTTSRGMLVTVLYRLEGAPATALPAFPDVALDQYYAGPVAWASSNGIVSGYGGNESGLFGPDNPITREQLATVLYRYAGKKGYKTSQRGDLSGFADLDSLSSYAQEAMSWAVGAGLISGTGGNVLAPAETATRAQVATMLMRFCRNVAQLGAGTD